MLLASATLLTGCSIGGKEIVLDINTTNSHTVFSVDNMKCDKTEALIYLANYKNLYATAAPHPNVLNLTSWMIPLSSISK